MIKIIKDLFRWDSKQFVKATIGVLIFSFAINTFLVPLSLYSGGAMGLSQLIRTIIVDSLNLKVNFDIAGLLYYLINIPLLVIAYKKISKSFFFRTLFCVSLMTLCLTFIPIPNKPILDEVLACTLVGSLIAGYGNGLILSSSGSTGGIDIIGIAAIMRNNKLSVGKLGFFFNTILYSISGILYGVPVMIYSILFSFFESFVIDRTHEQNICSTAMIFTKNNPKGIIKYVEDVLDRDTTYWEAIGSYKETKTYICYVVLSKYELQLLERHLNKVDPTAFVVKTTGVGIDGKFKKSI